MTLEHLIGFPVFRRVLRDSRQARAFNFVMAVLLVLAMILALLPDTPA